jgi:hypothetical protein
MAFGEDLSVEFTYETVYTGDVHLFAQPVDSTGNFLSGGAFQPSATFSEDSGRVSRTLSINSGKKDVQHIRLLMTVSDTENELYDTIVEVDYHYQDHVIHNISFSPSSPQSILLGRDITAYFDYKTSHSNNIRLFAEPTDNSGNLVAGGAFEPSVTYSANSGNASRTLTVSGNDADVDFVRFLMTDEDASVELYDTIVPVDYAFREFIVLEATFDPEEPDTLLNGNEVTAHIEYALSEKQEFKIQAVPVADGTGYPANVMNESAAQTFVQGRAKSSFSNSSGILEVDSVRVDFVDVNTESVYSSAFVPAQYRFTSLTALEEIRDETARERDKSLQVYPVPAEQGAILIAETKFSLQSFYLYDLDGSIIKQGNAKGKQFSIHTGKLDAGIYILEVKGETKTMSTKIVIR